MKGEQYQDDHPLAFGGHSEGGGGECAGCQLESEYCPTSSQDGHRSERSKGGVCGQGIDCRSRRPRGHWRWLEMCLRAEVGLPLQGHSCSVLCELLFSIIPIAALHPVYNVKKIPKHGVQRAALLPAPRGIFLAKPVRTAVPRCKATNRSARRLALEQVGTHAA